MNLGRRFKGPARRTLDFATSSGEGDNQEGKNKEVNDHPESEEEEEVDYSEEVDQRFTLILVPVEVKLRLSLISVNNHLWMASISPSPPTLQHFSKLHLKSIPYTSTSKSSE